MTAILDLPPPPVAKPTDSTRLDYLDATRAFALLLGVVFHAGLSFMPYFAGWAVMDVSTSAVAAGFVLVSHSFRMELFFLLAGFFGRVTLRRRGMPDFVRSRAVRLIVPFVIGWFLLRPLLVSGWIMGFASMRGDYHVWPALRDGIKTLDTLPAGLFSGTHLWFLYYLVLVTALALAGRAGLARTGAGHDRLRRRLDVALAWFAESPWQIPLVVVPIGVTLWQMQQWAMDTPDQTMVPQPRMLAMYGGFFVFGWLLARQPNRLAALARLSWSRVTVAAASVAASLLLSVVERDLGNPHIVAAHVGFDVAYATMMWTLLWLTVGTFQRLCSRPNAVIRYLADSSYWVYLVHLPVVVWLQVALANAHAPWPLKLTVIVAGSVAFALLTYDLFVRSTAVGLILNGRRRPRALFSQGDGLAGGK